MTKMTVQRKEVLPTGDYLAQIVTFEKKNGNYGEQIEIDYEVVKPAKFAGHILKSWCNPVLTIGTKRSKLVLLVEAAFNRRLNVDEEVDLNDIIGRQLVLTVLREQKDNGAEFAKVQSMAAYPKTPVFPEPDKPTSFDEDDDDTAGLEDGAGAEEGIAAAVKKKALKKDDPFVFD